MMGPKQEAQAALFYEFSLEDHVPQDHLLRSIDRFVDLSDIRQYLAKFYSHTGRPSIDPELLIRMLLVGYCCGIRSERRLCEEVHLNLAYRWFCRLDLSDPIPNHSTFSKNRHGRFRESELLRHVFEKTVARCIADGLVSGQRLAADASLIEADANKQNSTPKEDWDHNAFDPADAPRAVKEYLDFLDDAAFGAASEVEPKFTSHSDPSSQWTAARKGPAFFAYSTNYLIDTDHSVIVDVEGTRSIRQAEVGSVRIMLDRIKDRHDLDPERLIADSAYGSGPMLGWLVDREINPHIPVLDKSGRTDGTWSRTDFEWDAENIRAIKDDLAAGKACVIQVVSTGESLLKRRLETMDAEDELVEGALTPRDYVLDYLEQAFPIHAQKLVEIDGNMVAEPLRDETGALVVSREALALRDAAMMELMTLAPIPSALDQILWAFGDEAVAEVTGRSIRPLKAEDGHLFIEKRAASSNSSETQAFMDGEKDILIFSDAGGTGRSYHAAQTAKNQKRRRHYLLEPGWRADAAIQGLGRTHRSAQVSAPFFRVCTSDVHGEKRFTSTIAKRLDQLGALTKGQRETGSQGMFREEDNLESPIARAALRGYFADLAAGRAEAMSYESFTDWTALRLIDKDGVLLEELPPIQRFLNRVLALPIHMQNALFAEFMRRIADQTERARAAGTLDLGVETLRGEKIEQVSTEDLWTCPKSGAVTRIIGLEVTDPVHVLGAEEALSRNPDKLPMVNRASGRVGLISARPMQMYDEDIVTLMRKAVRPNRSSYLEETRFESSAWEEIGRPEFARLWDAAAASLPKTTTTKLYLLTGLLLPIWKDIPTTNERIYQVTPDGATAMIGRTLSEEGAAALRARFLVSNPQTPQEMLTAALGTTAPVDLGRGLSLTRRRVAGEMRLELSGTDRGMIESLKAMGCFTEIIAFQLRVFLPHGDGVDTGSILARIVGQGPAITADQAA